MMNLTMLFGVLAIFFIPLIGIYIGIRLVISDDNNKWQQDNKGANIVRGGR
jgi:hypothetical protein